MSSDELANAETLPGSGDPPGEPSRLAAGTVLRDRYRIERFLGAGGMGAVYAAHDTKLDHAVALKFVVGARSDVERDRLRAEVRTLQGLTHRGIARTYTYDEADGEPFIVMELLAGETLAARIARGRLDEAEVRGLLGALAAALDEAHRAGVVHRDVKPANVMLCDGGRVVLMDFGLARADDAPAPAGEARSVLMTTSLKGTPAYLAPEMALGRRVDARADLYSLGVVAYEALTGKLPFEAESAKGMIDQHVERVPEAVRVRRPDISAALSALVARMLAKEPAARPASAAAVIAALAPRRRRWPWVVAAALAAVLAVIAVIVVTQDDARHRPLDAARMLTVDAATKAQVRAEYDRAEAAYLESRFADALEAWKDAYAIVPDPVFLYNMGATMHMAGKKSGSGADLGQAAAYYRRYLQLAPEAPAHERAQIEKTLEVIDRAAAAAGPSPGDHERAQEILQRGLDAYAKHDYEVAIDLFEEAYTIYPSERLVLNLATTHADHGNPRRALFFYTQYLKLAPTIAPEQRTEIERKVAELRATIDALRAP